MKLKNRLKYWGISFSLFSVFLLLSTVVHYDLFRKFDYDSMLFMQYFASPLVDYVFSVFTLLGSSESILLIVVVSFLYLFFRKKRLVFSLFLYILIYPVELLGKLVIFHPKPPVFLNRYVFDFHLPSSYVVETSYSFPSGHMARSAFVVGLLAFLIIKSRLGINRKLTGVLISSIYLLVMFISRMYLGEHWFSDVLGGSLLGFSIAFLTFSLW